MIDNKLQNILNSIDGKKNCESDAFWNDCCDFVRGTSVKEFLEDLEFYVGGYSEWNHDRNPEYMKEDRSPKEYKLCHRLYCAEKRVNPKTYECS